MTITRGFWLLPFFALISPAGAQTWEFKYYPADDADNLSVCTAGIYYGDGPFLIRVYNQVMDFYLADDELALPPGQVLGNVVFDFRADSFILSAETSDADGSSTVNYLFLTPDTADYEELLQAMRYSSDFSIIFPDGTNFTINLQGSNAALLEAFECWSNSQTGVGGHNPFGDANTGSNPFQ